MATHSSILVWGILWTEEPGGLYSPSGHKELETTKGLSLKNQQYLLLMLGLPWYLRW